MKKQNKVIIAVASGLLLLTIVRLAIKGFFKPKTVNSEEEVVVEINGTTILVTEPNGGEVLTHEYSGYNMPFPLQKDLTCNDGIAGGCDDYDNVANVQTYIALNMASGEFAIDGKFGNDTEAAVEDLVTGMEDYGYLVMLPDTETMSGGVDYIAMDARYKTITEEFYNGVIMPFLDNL